VEFKDVDVSGGLEEKVNKDEEEEEGDELGLDLGLSCSMGCKVGGFLDLSSNSSALIDTIVDGLPDSVRWKKKEERGGMVSSLLLPLSSLLPSFRP